MAGDSSLPKDTPEPALDYKQDTPTQPSHPSLAQHLPYFLPGVCPMKTLVFILASAPQVAWDTGAHWPAVQGPCLTERLPPTAAPGMRSPLLPCPLLASAQYPWPVTFIPLLDVGPASVPPH